MEAARAWQGLLSCDLLSHATYGRYVICIMYIFNKPTVVLKVLYNVRVNWQFQLSFLYHCKKSSDCCAGGGRGFISMVNINGPAATAGPLSAARRLGGPSAAAAGFSPPGSRNSTPALPPSHIAHGAQVHVGGSGTNGSRTALGVVSPPKPTLPTVERANSADSRRKIRYSKRLVFSTSKGTIYTNILTLLLKSCHTAQRVLRLRETHYIFVFTAKSRL